MRCSGDLRDDMRQRLKLSEMTSPANAGLLDYNDLADLSYTIIYMM